MSNQDYIRTQAENDAIKNKGYVNTSDWGDQERKTYEAERERQRQIQQNNSDKK